MAQKSNKPNSEQNRIKIDMNIGQITDRKLKGRQLRNRVIPVTAPQVPPRLETFIHVFLYGQALAGAIFNRYQIYGFRILAQQKNLDQNL